MEKVSILINPSAGKGKAIRNKKILERFLRQFEVPYDLAITQSEEDLRELTRKNARKYQILAGVGGDSTFNIMINEIMKEGVKVNLSMIGLGSSNDLTKEFQVDSLEKACLALKKMRTKKIDLGCIVLKNVHLHYFLGQANIGLGVFVNKHVAGLMERRPWLGKHQRLAGILAIINSYRSKKIPLFLTVESEEGKFEGEFILAIFNNIRYWATGKMITPEAKPDDGKLDCCLIKKCSLTQLARISILANKGKHTETKEVQTFQSCSFELSSEQTFEIQTDGEILGGLSNPARFNKVSFETIPRALNIIY